MNCGLAGALGRPKGQLIPSFRLSFVQDNLSGNEQTLNFMPARFLLSLRKRCFREQKDLTVSSLSL
jgi:hypothetical protein